MTILIVTNNQKNELEICINAIQKFADIEAFSIVVVDNYSSDDTAQWLMEKTEIASARTEEVEGIAKIINEAIEIFGIEDDLLIMTPDYAITPHCLSNMLHALYSDEKVAVAVPVISNRIGVHNYIDAIRKAEENNGQIYKRKAGFGGQCFLLAYDKLEKIGWFDEQICGFKEGMDDYILRGLMQGLWMVEAQNAIVYCMVDNRIVLEEEARKAFKEKWGFEELADKSVLELVSFIKEKPGQQMGVLVIGCGVGDTLCEIRNRFPNALVYGIEQNISARKAASFIADEVEEDFVGGYPFDAKKFNYILVESSYADKAEIHKILRHCYVYLLPDGALLMEKTATMPYKELDNYFKRYGYEVSAVKAAQISTGKAGYHLCLHKKQRKPALVLMGINSILYYNAEQICDAYVNAGYEVCCVKPEELFVNEVRSFMQRGIERVWVLNNTGWIVRGADGQSAADNMWDIMQVANYNFLFDSPIYYDDTLQMAPVSGKVLCVDRNHVTYIKRFYKNIKDAFFVPLAGDNEISGLDRSWGERSIDVLYCGSCKFDINTMYLADKERQIILKVLDNWDCTTEQIIEMLERESDAEKTEEEIKEAIECYKKVDWWVMTYMRREVVRSLVEAGINVTVYGAGWENFEYFNSPYFTFGGYISQEECLEKMKDTKIVLNTMPCFKDGIHDRVINAMLAGAVCLTDTSGYMEEVFEAGKDYVSYDLKHLEQLPEIVKGILQNDNEAMRQSAYEKANEKHRWIHRIKEFEMNEGYYG